MDLETLTAVLVFLSLIGSIISGFRSALKLGAEHRTTLVKALGALWAGRLLAPFVLMVLAWNSNYWWGTALVMVAMTLAVLNYNLSPEPAKRTDTSTLIVLLVLMPAW